MADEVLFSQPYGSVLLDTRVPCLVAQWHTFANATEFLTLQQFVLAYLEAHATPARPWGLVGDVRHMGAIPAKVQEWLAAEFNPRVTALGVREMSIVVAENVFGQIATQRYAQETAQARARYELATVFYDSLAAAKAGARLALAPR